MPQDFRKIEKRCLNCGYSLKLNNNRDVKRKKYCSKSCQTKYLWKIGKCKGLSISEKSKKKMSLAKQGKYDGINNPRYIDGRTIFRKRLILSGREMRCFVCGDKNNLIAHHIEPCIRAETRGRQIICGNHSLNNLDWLCRKHHDWLHKKFEERKEEIYVSR